MANERYQGPNSSAASRAGWIVRADRCDVLESAAKLGERTGGQQPPQTGVGDRRAMRNGQNKRMRGRNRNHKSHHSGGGGGGGGGGGTITIR